MKKVLKVLEVELTAGGPVYIGNGRKIEKKEYAYFPDKKEVAILDKAKLTVLLSSKNMMNQYKNFILGSDRADLGSWLEAHGIPYDKYRQCIRYRLDSGDAVDKTHSVKAIDEFIKDAYGLPYVPGSSIKGMLRTALLAYDISRKPSRYDGIKENIKKTDMSRFDRKKLLYTENRNLDETGFRVQQSTGLITLKKESRPGDIVNDIMAGIIVSDSEPLSVSDLILCGKIDTHTDGTERKLNVVREALRPGTKIKFTITIDTSVCSLTKEDIENAIGYFSRMYYECFLKAFSIDRPAENTVWLGGGAGFVSKTEIYPVFDKKDGIDITKDILESTVSKNNKIGGKQDHKHSRDKSYGASPHICKMTCYKGTKYQMGLCLVKMTEIV